MVTAANAAITQMSSVATPRLTGVNRSSAVFVAMPLFCGLATTSHYRADDGCEVVWVPAPGETIQQKRRLTIALKPTSCWQHARTCCD